MNALLREVAKTVGRWTSGVCCSYQHARSYGQSRRKATRFAIEIAAASQGVARMISAREYIKPADIRPRGGYFLPNAFDKGEAEAAAVLLVLYFQEEGVWAPFRLDVFAAWLRRCLEDHRAGIITAHTPAEAQRKLVRNATVAALSSNPFWSWEKGMARLLLKRWVVPVFERKITTDQLLCVTDEFIMRGRLSSIGLRAQWHEAYAFLGSTLLTHLGVPDVTA